MSTKSQRMAQAAFRGVQQRSGAPETYRKEYRSFAREFPTLVHQCGLAQAVAFAQAKGAHQAHYVNDLAAVLASVGHGGIANATVLAEQTHALPMAGYVRLSRDALDAAVWMKRYVEALFPEKEETPRKQEGKG